MTASQRDVQRWCVVVVFAIAMAWVESATVYYLRVMVDRVVPYQADPLPVHGVLGPIEIVREGSTLIMLLTVGMLAATTWYRRLAYTVIAFGVWDIFYYVFLYVMSGWPTSLLDWDVLFLIPLPWWGPVLAPVSIALLMIVWGTLASQGGGAPQTAAASGLVWGLTGLGIALALYVFMADSLRAVSSGVQATRDVLPSSFNWSAFVVALALMAAPVAEAGWRLTASRNGRPSEPSRLPITQ